MKRIVSSAIFIISILAIGAAFLPKRKSELVQTKINKNDEIRSFWDAYNHATSLRSDKQFEAAIVHYRKALQANPAHEESLYYLGSCLLETGDSPGATQAYEKILTQNPRSTRALSQLAMIYSTDGPGHRSDVGRAEEMLRRLLIINREESGPYLRLGLLELQLQDYENAFSYFNTAAGFKSPEGLFFCGYVKYRQSNFDEASAFFTRVLEINRKEKQISGRGVFSEGDVQNESVAMSLLEKSGVKALAFLYWTSVKLGSYPGHVPEEFRVSSPAVDRPAVHTKVLTETSHSERPAIIPSGLDIEGTVLDVVEFDYDQNGIDEILLLLWKQPPKFFRNQGNGKFVDVTTQSNLPVVVRNSYSAVILDYDQDQYPDLLITEQAPYESALKCFVHPEIRLMEGVPRLFRNMRNNTFQEVTAKVGLQHAYGTMDAAVADLNQDGWPDVVLANGGLETWRMEPSVALINQQGKRFVEQYLPSPHEPLNSRSVRVQVKTGKPPTIYLQN